MVALFCYDCNVYTMFTQKLGTIGPTDTSTTSPFLQLHVISLMLVETRVPKYRVWTVLVPIRSILNLNIDFLNVIVYFFLFI